MGPASDPFWTGAELKVHIDLKWPSNGIGINFKLWSISCFRWDNLFSTFNISFFKDETESLFFVISIICLHNLQVLIPIFIVRLCCFPITPYPLVLKGTSLSDVEKASPLSSMSCRYQMFEWEVGTYLLTSPAPLSCALCPPPLSGSHRCHLYHQEGMCFVRESTGMG